MAVKTDFGNKQTSAHRFSTIPVLFNEYCTQKINVDTKSLFLHIIIHDHVCSMFAKSAFSFSSALDVLKIKN